MDDNVIDLGKVADSIMKIAEGMPNVIENAIFIGYTEAVKAFRGFGGEVTINANAWKSIGDGSEKATSQIKMPGVGENDVVIFSPKTAKDRTEINYAELFVSPDVKNSEVCISCAREPRTTITLVYFIIRGGGTAIPDSSTSDNQGNSNGDSDETLGVEVPIEEED